MSLKSTVKENFPALADAVRWLRALPRRIELKRLPREEVFTRRYREGGWESSESKSGSGSTESATRVVRAALPEVVRELGARSFLDVPCGDFHWMKDVDLGVERYIGADIVGDIVARNRERYADEVREFRQLDLANDELPDVDILFCRDCLVHLSTADVQAALANIRRSNVRYLLTTTFTDCRVNVDIVTGEWRPLNLEKPPFGFPPALRTISEECTEVDGRYADKSLGLWRVADLPG